MFHRHDICGAFVVHGDLVHFRVQRCFNFTVCSEFRNDLSIFDRWFKLFSMSMFLSHELCASF